MMRVYHWFGGRGDFLSHPAQDCSLQRREKSFNNHRYAISIWKLTVLSSFARRLQLNSENTICKRALCGGQSDTEAWISAQNEELKKKQVKATKAIGQAAQDSGSENEAKGDNVVQTISDIEYSWEICFLVKS